MSDQGRSIPNPDAGDQTVVERIDPLVGSIIDKRYRVEFRLAAGGFGAIYKATHIKSGHVVALKVLHREMASDPRVVARFRREGDALTSLRDPHTITAYEIGEDASGALFIVMELLHGESLYERFRGRGPLPWRQVAAIGEAICSSLAEAHARGIVHRDLKPANIHLEPRDGEPDYVKVLDFGIAKIINGGGNNADLTNAGQMIGTFDYMSPEQMVGDCTTRSDIYTLGVLMYEMTCGVRPFHDVAGPTSLLAALITRSPPRLSTRVAVPPDLDDIVMRCLEKEPSARFADVLALQRELHRLLLPSLPGEDEATVAIQLPTGGLRGRATAPAPIVGDEPTWLGEVNAPVTLPPRSGYTPTPGSNDVTPTPGVTPMAAADRRSRPVFQPPAPPPQPPVVFPPARSVPPRRYPSAPPPLPGQGYAPPDLASAPMRIAPERGSAPVMFPAGAYTASPRAPTGPQWSPGTDPAAPRQGAEVRSFDMAAATSRDAWVGRILWIVLIAIGLAVVLFLLRHH